MKLAEALILRADCQKRLAQLKERLLRAAKVQEGDAPPEDPAALLEEVDRLTLELQQLIQRINRTNNSAAFPGGDVGRMLECAQRAYALGIVSDVVPAETLADAAAKLADEVAAGGPLAVAAAKRAIDEGATLPLADALAVEAACYQEVLASDDRNEGLTAFAEKRPPVFKGK